MLFDSNNYDNYNYQIKKIFSEISKLSEQEHRKIFNYKIYKRHSYLLKEGEYCQNINYLKTGILRNFYLKDGNEIISSFTFPDEISTILHSILQNEPSRENIQAITDCEVITISIDDYQKLKIKYSKIEELDIKITQFYALILEERLFSMKFHTAIERYQMLLKREPMVVKNIPLTYIASYLGISIETLSRIRAHK
jgi:CRP-like cAMP-binding protein